MGNLLWSCKYCNHPNYGDYKICVKCLKDKDTGKTENSLALFSKSSIKELEVKETSGLKFLLNQKASQSKSAIEAFNYGYLDHFIDNDFPPSKQSLYMNGNRIRRINLLHSSGFRQVKKWLRPNEIAVPSEEKYLPVSLFSDPSPKDVLQGELGTCWFLSALALLAEKPLLLLNCMVTQTYNSYGVHQVRLNRRGEWVIVDVDDYLPCDKNNILVFSSARRRQFWVPLMEKALAKLYGSYEAVARGACAEGLQSLTGEPCEVLYLQLGTTSPTSHNLYARVEDNSPYAIWQKLLYSKNSGYLLTTLCYNEKFNAISLDRVGLLNRHIYSILDVREFDNYGEKIQLIRLRNPVIDFIYKNKNKTI
jgi:calpain-15